MLSSNNKSKIDLKIKPLKSGRDFLKVRPLMENGTIPAMGSHMIIGRTGSGKTCMVANLLKDKNKLCGFFDYVYVFCLSPSNLLLDHCPDVKKNNIIRDDDPAILSKILDSQKKIIEEDGFKKAPKLLFIMDDVISSNKFLNSKPLKDLFFAGTNMKCATYIMSQSYVKVPRSLRINSHSLFLFHGLTETELKRFADEHQPAELSKDEFMKMTKHATDEPFSFLFCNCTVNNKKQKFRKNFDTILQLK
jgi:hypothetical protein